MLIKTHMSYVCSKVGSAELLNSRYSDMSERYENVSTSMARYMRQYNNYIEALTLISVSIPLSLQKKIESLLTNYELSLKRDFELSALEIYKRYKLDGDIDKELKKLSVDITGKALELLFEGETIGSLLNNPNIIDVDE